MIYDLKSCFEIEELMKIKVFSGQSIAVSKKISASITYQLLKILSQFTPSILLLVQIILSQGRLFVQQHEGSQRELLRVGQSARPRQGRHSTSPRPQCRRQSASTQTRRQRQLGSWHQTHLSCRQVSN